MQNRDILWAVSIPFRMYNTKRLDINTFIFTLSFDANLPNCNVSTTRKLASIALEKGWIEKAEGGNILHAKFELWQPKLFPPSWNPKFVNLGKVSMINLMPLDSTVEYKPKLIKMVKKTKFVEMEPLYTSKSTKNGEKSKDDEVKDVDPKKQLEKKKDVIKEKKPTSKKRKTTKKAKKKGQKNIQDFFK
ncbi:MAG: DUF2240 family protein [Promethearchaeota archaeon]